jgi:cytochrome c-type biogenesis protein CcmF
MNAALGTTFIYLGLAASLLGLITIVTGLAKHRVALVVQGRLYAFVILAVAVGAFAVMERALITRDFSVQYVYEHGSSRTPRLYNFATIWSALEGSILLWVLVLSIYIALVARRFRAKAADPMFAWAMVVLFSVSTFFFLLLAGPAHPFQKVAVAAGYDGPGPNPLLQNHPLVAIHPPMLYLGYVGFTVPFAFAIASLVTGRVGEGWLIETRRWTLFAWGFLTVGIVLGAWWSYEVLGWGGYWGWDPIENASFLPWLTGTAYLHSVMVQERRGMLRVWNLSLVCATFALTILGTFLARSGVIQSVHAFANGGIGPMLLGFFAVVMVVTVGLIGWRGDKLRSPGSIDSPLSREGAFLANNVLFAAFAFVVLLGTVFPLIVEALRGDKISVGTPYFDRMSMPIGLTLLFLMAIAPVLPWRKASTELLSKRLFWPAWIGVGAMAIAIALGGRGAVSILAFGLGGFAGGAAMRQIVLATRRQGWRGLLGRTNGGMIVHIGVILIAMVIAASQSYVKQQEITLDRGATGRVAGYDITYVGTETNTTPQKVKTKVLLQVNHGQVYAPALSQFPFGSQDIRTPSVKTGLTRDLMLAIAGDIPTDTTSPVTVRVVVQPLIVWMWIGGLLMGLGTVLAAFPGRRRRLPTQATSAISQPEPDSEPELAGAR